MGRIAHYHDVISIIADHAKLMGAEQPKIRFFHLFLSAYKEGCSEQIEHLCMSEKDAPWKYPSSWVVLDPQQLHC